jgi:hypothetical protein
MMFLTVQDRKRLRSGRNRIEVNMT